MAKKKSFNVEEDILGIANEIKNIKDETKESLKNLTDNPNRENFESAVVVLKEDTSLDEKNRRRIIEALSSKYFELFDFNNCPDDYQTLKGEAKFLSGLTQYNFLLMAQRLLKIRDGELYLEDGYKSFKDFIENEIELSRQTAYKYIDIVLYYGDRVVPGRHESESFDYTKLLPFIPLLKADDSTIPKEEIKTKTIDEMKRLSRVRMTEEANSLKERYGIVISATKNRGLLNKIKNEIKKLSRSEFDELLDYLKNL